MPSEQKPQVEEASASMRVFARNVRDMYVALMAEGFTKAEAIAMCGQVIGSVVSARKDGDV